MLNHYFCRMNHLNQIFPKSLVLIWSFLAAGLLSAQQLNEEGIKDLAASIHRTITQENIKSVAVFDFTDVVGQSSPLGESVSDMLRDELSKIKTNYEVTSKYIQENAMRQGGITTEDLFDDFSASELGKSLGTDVVVSGIIEPGKASEMTFMLKALKSEDAEMIYIEREKVYKESSITEENDKDSSDGVIKFKVGGNKDKKDKRQKDKVTDPDEEKEVDEWKGFSIGLNLGAYFANKKSAAFYNGSCAYGITGATGEVRCYEIFERLTLTQQEINYILSYYNISGQQFERPADIYPANMRYSPALLFGLHIKYNFNRENGIVFNANFMRLKSVDKFSLRFPPDPNIPNTTENIQLFDITGEEDRFQLSLAYRLGAMMNDNTNFYFDIGGTMLGTRVRSNEIFVADRTYSLFIGAANPFQIIQYAPRTDLGFGYLFGAGMEFYFENNYSMDIGISYSRDEVVLGEFKQRLGNISIVASFTL